MHSDGAYQRVIEACVPLHPDYEVNSETVLWRLVLTLIIAAQLLALGSGLKRSLRLAGGAVAFTPALLLLSAFLVQQEQGDADPFPPLWAAVFLTAIAVPLIVGAVYLASPRRVVYPLWLAWLINWTPFALVAFMVCCFKIEIW